MLSKHTFYALAAIAVLSTLTAPAEYRRQTTPDIRPTVPTADRSAGNRVFLERADFLIQHPGDTFVTVTGDVVFTKGPMIMHCDSAHYTSDNESMSAFGNVSMEQGDTLFVYADELYYDGPTEIATFIAFPGKKVRLINRDVVLKTDEFVYDLGIDLGYYEVGGELTDPSNTLTSLKGEYDPNSKDANFYTDVHLFSRNSTDTLNIYSDTLNYNTQTHIAELFSPSTVINARGTIYTRNGVYDTDSNRTLLYDRSLIVTSQGQTLTADTIYYDRNAFYGEAWGNMILTDTTNHTQLQAAYGYYDEKADSSFATGKALVKEFSGEDTLYMHGRYIESFLRFDSVAVAADTLVGIEAHTRIDTSHVAVVYPRVRFYRSDMQGICDSLRFTQADSTLRMFINPVIWNEEQQIFGNVIEILLNDSTVERATLPDQGFTAQLLEGDHYNQMSGKKMTAFFEAGEMRRLEIDGNVEIIMYPEEADSTINKIVTAESSFLTAWFRNRAAERIKVWPQTSGTATPLFLARKSMYYLPKFKWYGQIRPTSPEDVFIVPDLMESLMLGKGRNLMPRAIYRRNDNMPIDIPAAPKEALPLPEPSAEGLIPESPEDIEENPGN